MVLSTVRDAADSDYRVFVLADASADRDREVHDFLTGKIFPARPTVRFHSPLRGAAVGTKTGSPRAAGGCGP